MFYLVAGIITITTGLFIRNAVKQDMQTSRVLESFNNHLDK